MIGRVDRCGWVELLGGVRVRRRRRRQRRRRRRDPKAGKGRDHHQQQQDGGCKVGKIPPPRRLGRQGYHPRRVWEVRHRHRRIRCPNGHDLHPPPRRRPTATTPDDE